MELKNLNAVLEEIQDLKLSHELLEEVWRELGPYNTALSYPLRNQLRNRFGFDDSE